MPWHVSTNIKGCNGYAVVKDDDGSVEGCHATRAAANRQLAALHASEAGVKKNMDMAAMLTPDEKDFHDALVAIAQKHGKFNMDGTGIWSGYEPALENKDAEYGIKCSNCAFYQGPGNCEIIDAVIEPEGKCRLAAIPDGLVNWDDNDEDMNDKVFKNDFWGGRFK